MIAKSLRVAVLAFPVVALMSTSVSAQELKGAFIFGSRDLDCDIPGSEDKFTMVYHAGNDQASHDAMAYTAEKGYGLVVTDPGNTGRNGSSQFGPFDNSPNNRNEFGDDCPEQIYDSFIGWKNYETDCDAETQGEGKGQRGPRTTSSPVQRRGSPNKGSRRCRLRTTRSRQRKLTAATDDDVTIYKTAVDLFDTVREPMAPVRLLGVAVTDLRDRNAPEQRGLFPEEAEDVGKSEEIMKAMDRIRDRFGEDSIRHGLS